jgi:hypothetical protein
VDAAESLQLEPWPLHQRVFVLYVKLHDLVAIPRACIGDVGRSSNRTVLIDLRTCGPWGQCPDLR